MIDHSLSEPFNYDLRDDVADFNLYKFKLKNIDHFQYTYDPKDVTPDLMKVKSARFISEIAMRSNTGSDVEGFVFYQKNIGAITYDESRNIYTVNLEKVDYDYK